MYQLDQTKAEFHWDRVNKVLREEPVSPVTVDMALTRSCNYRCVYCYSKLQKNPGKLTLDSALEMLDDFETMGVKAVSLVSDGESTLAPFFEQFVYHAEELGIDIAVGTNGYLFPYHATEPILKALTYLRFNISAGTATRYGEIHGVHPSLFDYVVDGIRFCIETKRRLGLTVTIGMQMVLMPEFEDQILPLADLAVAVGADYLIIKHCSDDELGTLGIDYSRYERLSPTLKEAELRSTDRTQVSVKWKKIGAGNRREYTSCWGPRLQPQLSGSGLVAPCGMFFNPKYRRFHMGHLNRGAGFKKIWESKKARDILDYLSSPSFNPQKECGCLCLQHHLNQYLWEIKTGKREAPSPTSAPPPPHVNFI